MMTVADRLRLLREDKGLTAKDVAMQLDINPSTISKLENSRKSIDSDELRKYSLFFSTSADYILGLDEEKESIVMYMKRDKQLEDNDIAEAEFIMSLMDEAVDLYNMKKKL